MIRPPPRSTLFPYTTLSRSAHAKVPPKNTPGPAIRIIIDADAVEPVIVLLRPSAGDGKLRAKAAVTAAVPGRIRRLRLEQHNSRLQNRQVGPTPAVQR